MIGVGDLHSWIEFADIYRASHVDRPYKSHVTSGYTESDLNFSIYKGTLSIFSHCLDPTQILMKRIQKFPIGYRF